VAHGMVALNLASSEASWKPWLRIIRFRVKALGSGSGLSGQDFHALSPYRGGMRDLPRYFQDDSSQI